MAILPSAASPAVAKLVESGYGKQENELPIDINYQKLAEWLVTRKKMPNDWHKRAQAIQAKITEAVEDLPPELLAQLPGGADAPIDYFRAVQIRDKLAEGGERTLFGGLTGAAGLWDNIVKAYEKQNVYMGEAASSMVANVDYELPYIRKQAARYAQLISDAERKGAEYIKSAASCANNFKQECARLGIQGSNVRSELLGLGRQLPGMFQDIVGQLRSEQLGDAIAYYQNFVAYAHAAGGNHQHQAEEGGPEVLSTLSEVRDGCTAPPAERAEGSTEAAAEASGPGAGGSIDIDWDAALLAGASGGGEGAGTASAEGNGGSGIDWDLDLSDLAVAVEGAEGGDETAAASGNGGGEGGPSISWDIELTEAAAEDAVAAEALAGATRLVTAVSSSAPGGGGGADAAACSAAAGGDGSGGGAPQVEAAALRLEHDHDYRSLLLDDLQELRAFLLQRASELESGGGGGSSSDLLNALLPPAVAAVDARGARRLLVCVEGALASLNDTGLRQLLLISSSSRYLDRLARELSRKAGQEGKMLAAAKEVEARRHESRAALAALAPKSAALAERTRVAQRAVEAALSAQLGRRVNILGEINNALAAAAAAAKAAAE